MARQGHRARRFGLALIQHPDIRRLFAREKSFISAPEAVLQIARISSRIEQRMHEAIARQALLDFPQFCTMGRQVQYLGFVLFVRFGDQVG